MTYFWLAFILLLVIFFIAKQHADRQRPAKILTITPADGMAPPIAKEVTKSWWEEMLEKGKMIGYAAIFLVLGWALHGCMSL